MHPLLLPVLLYLSLLIFPTHAADIISTTRFFPSCARPCVGPIAENVDCPSGAADCVCFSDVFVALLANCMRDVKCSEKDYHLALTVHYRDICAEAGFGEEVILWPGFDGDSGGRRVTTSWIL